MKTKFKTSSTKKNSTKSVKGFSIKGGKVDSLREYYKLKYPSLFKTKSEKQNLSYLNNLNFRNSQNYAVGNFMKNKIDKKEPFIFNNSFLRGFNYSLFILFLVFIGGAIELHNKVLFLFSIGIIFLMMLTYLLKYIFNKFKNIRTNIKYKFLSEKYQSRNLILRLRIKDKINRNDFIIIKK